MFAMGGMAVQSGRKHGIDVGEIVDDILYHARLKRDAVASAMGLHPSHLSRALKGEKGYAIDLHRLPEVDDLDETGEVIERIFARLLIQIRRRRMVKAGIRSLSDERKVG